MQCKQNQDKIWTLGSTKAFQIQEWLQDSVVIGFNRLDKR